MWNPKTKKWSSETWAASPHDLSPVVSSSSDDYSTVSRQPSDPGACPLPCTHTRNLTCEPSQLLNGCDPCNPCALQPQEMPSMSGIYSIWSNDAKRPAFCEARDENEHDIFGSNPALRSEAGRCSPRRRNGSWSCHDPSDPIALPGRPRSRVAPIGTLRAVTVQRRQESAGGDPGQILSFSEQRFDPEQQVCTALLEACSRLLVSLGICAPSARGREGIGFPLVLTKHHAHAAK